MIALLDTSESLEKCSEEIGHTCGQLLTPLTRFRLKSDVFAIDNGAYAGFDRVRWERVLQKNATNADKCLWVSLPDCVGSAIRTAELWDAYRYHPALHGYRKALVAQDGIEAMRIPWDEIDAIFIGGSTVWKLGRHAAEVISTAHAMGKKTHVGRVNTPSRWRHFERLGVHTCDGTGISRYRHMRVAIKNRYNQMELEL